MADTKASRRLAHNLYMREWRKVNKDKCSASDRAWRRKNPEKQAYGSSKTRAKHRGIPFLLTFDEWWKIWQDSGNWERRGSRRGQYVMARYKDRGAYAIGNVRICTAAENQSEQALYLRAETRRLRSENAKRQHLLNPLSEEKRKRFGDINRGKPRSEEVRRKISEAQLGKSISVETRAKLSEAAKAYWIRNKTAQS
jgi:NUMOD3 motif